jgi:molecular chaperone GrpE
MNDTSKQEQKQKQWQRIAEEAEQEVEQVSSLDEEEETEEGEKDAGTASLAHPSYKALEDKLTSTELKMHEYWEQVMRAKAELDNAQRRAERDVANAHKYALEKFSKELIPVIDSLEQALQLQVDDNPTAQQIHAGIELTLKLFTDVLQKFGIEQIDPMGEMFNPEQHEAMTMQPQENTPTNTIISVFQKGYLLNGRIIRPARVVVAK